VGTNARDTSGPETNLGSQTIVGTHDGPPQMRSIPPKVSRLGQAKSSDWRGQETNDNLMDLLAAREAIRLE